MKLKSWVEKTLILLFIFCLFILSGESCNIITFCISKIIAISLMIVIYNLLKKYGKIGE